MPNPTINQQINFDASVNLDPASQRRFEQQLGSGFFKKLEAAAKKAGAALASSFEAAAKTAPAAPKARLNTGVDGAAKKAAESLTTATKKVAADNKKAGRPTTTAAKGGGAANPAAATNSAMKAFRQSVQQIVKLVNTAIRTTMQQIQRITQAVTRSVGGAKPGRGQDPNDPAAKAANAAAAAAAKDPVGGKDKAAHVIVDSGKVEVTKQPPQPPTPPTPPKPPPPEDDPKKRTVIEYDPTKIVQMIMNMFDRIYNITKQATAGPVSLTQPYASPDMGFREAVKIAGDLGITTNEAAGKMNEALSAGVELGDHLESNMTEAIAVSEYTGVSVSELVTNSRKVSRNFKKSFDFASAAAGLSETTHMTIQESYAVVTAAMSSIGKSGVSVDSMVGRVQKMVGAFGDEIGPAMAQMQEVFRGQTLGDTIKEIMLMGPDAAADVLRKAESELGTDAFSQDTRKMIEKALASGDLIAMAEALQLVGPAAEDLAETFRGQKLGIGFGAQGLAAIARRQVLGYSAQQEQDLRVKRAEGVLGASGGVATGFKGDAATVRAAREQSLSITERTQKFLDETVLSPLAGAADVASTAMNSLAAAGKAASAALWAVVTGGDPVKAAEEEANKDPFLRDIFEAAKKPGGSKNDFIFQNKGGMARITPINSQDQFFGAKPGGAIDQAIASTAAGMTKRTGGRANAQGVASVNNVTVNINGGDLGKVYEVVRNVLQQSGVRPPAGAYA